MNQPQIESAAAVEIAPVYSGAIAQTVDQDFDDLKEMGGAR